MVLPPHRTLLPILTLALAATACSESGAPENAATDPVAEAKRVLRQADLDALRASFPERVASLCKRYRTDESPQAEACEKAGFALHERLLEKVEATPYEWQEQTLSLGRLCLRHAFRVAQSEIEGKTEAELFVQGLEEGPKCLDDSYTALIRQLREEAEGSEANS
jgi:hypothetical protein